MWDINRESADIAWTAPGNVDRLDMHLSMRRIAHHLEQRPACPCG